MANRGPKSAAALPARIGSRWRRRAIVAAAALALCWLGSAALRREATWKPDGAGFVRVSIIDAGGATDSVVVRLD